MKAYTSLILIFSFLVVFTTTLNSQTNYRECLSDWKKLNLKSKVYSIEEICFKAIDSNGVIIKGQRERTKYGQDTYDRHLIFDPSGYLIEETRYNSDNSFDSKINYQRDTLKNIAQGIMLDENDQVFIHNHIYSYNEKGQNVKDEVFVDESLEYSWTYTKDSIGNIIQENWINSSGEIEFKYLNIYDDENHLIEQKFFESDFDKPTFYNIYSYDLHGNVVNDKLKSYPQNEYETSIYYSYDIRKNWLSKTIVEDGEPKYIYERKIIYYSN